jgi:hypothetical protein
MLNGFKEKKNVMFVCDVDESCGHDDKKADLSGLDDIKGFF